MKRRIEIFPTRAALEECVAAELMTVVQSALDARGRADMVVTGGTVGIGTLAALARATQVSALDWTRIHVWWGDERFVPAGHADRNEQQARDALFSRVAIPAENLHTFPADHGQTVDQARDEFLAEYVGGFPAFDVVLSGIGPDGHTASLFPGFPHVWIIASGKDKADAVSRIVADSPESQTPAAALRGVIETVVWIDADAGSAITD
jgi:6-phosphogluconolactonase